VNNNTIDYKNAASNLDGIDKGGRNSPSNFDGGFIHSILEENEIPLIAMVKVLSYLNNIEF
jgi:hypothetical protein